MGNFVEDRKAIEDQVTELMSDLASIQYPDFPRVGILQAANDVAAANWQIEMYNAADKRLIELYDEMKEVYASYKIPADLMTFDIAMFQEEINARKKLCMSLHEIAGELLTIEQDNRKFRRQRRMRTE